VREDLLPAGSTLHLKRSMQRPQPLLPDSTLRSYGGVGPASKNVKCDLSLAGTRAAGKFRVRGCPWMHGAAHKLNG
jgi:hypothetical protein